MNILLALPLLPLLAALWFALSRRGDRQAACWVVALAAFFTIAVALLATSQDLVVTHLLVRGRTRLVLDSATRPALLLFGGLWLAAALLTRNRRHGPAPMTLLLGLSAAVTLAIARGGPLVFAAMLATGFGLYATLASESSSQWRGRWLVVLLVASDLLIFEVLLHGTAHPGAGMTRGLALLIGVALLLRSGAPPAHAWLPQALSAATAPTAILLAGIPAGAAFIGGRQLLQPAGADLGTAMLGLALAGALWSGFAATRNTAARETLGYAAAMTAALLLVTTPAITDVTLSVWVVVSLALCCAAVPIIGLQHAGWTRNAAVILVLASHGLAAAQAAVLAAAERATTHGFPAAIVAGSSTMLLAMALRRTGERPRDARSEEAGVVAIAFGGLAAIGLSFLWRAVGPGFASFWPAPVGITLGLLLLRRQETLATAGRLRGAADRLVVTVTRGASAVRDLCLSRLPLVRDRLQAAVAGLWHGQVWAERIASLELLLRQWPMTALLMVLVAIAAASLLAS